MWILFWNPHRLDFHRDADCDPVLLFLPVLTLFRHRERGYAGLVWIDPIHVDGVCAGCDDAIVV